MDQSSRCPFRTEHIQAQSEKSITFRDYLQKKNQNQKMDTLPSIKQQRWKKQLSTLLSSESSIHFGHQQLSVQVPVSELLIRQFRSQEQSPQKQSFIPEMTQYGGDQTPQSHFKFNSPKNKSNFRKTMSTRHCLDQLQQIQKTHKPKNQSLVPCMSQHEIIHKFFETKRNNSQQTISLKPFGTTERLDYEADALYNRITSDRMLRAKYANRHIKHLKDVYRSLLGVGYDKEVLLDPQRMRAIHAQLFIRKDQFIRFKYLFINQYMQMETPIDLVFKGCQRIEKFKPLILNQPLDFEIFGGDTGIGLVATIMYDKIFKDYTLSPFFRMIELEEQAMKFAKLFAQLIDHTESPNYTLETLRERHVKYKLTYVQLANFKFYLSTSLQQLNIRFRSIRSILRGMDTYKFAILNKNSLQESIFQTSGGFREFIDNFVKLCLQDPVLFDLIAKRGKSRFTQHCENMFYYFFRNNVKAITRDDIEHVHKHKDIINQKILEKFKEKALISIKRVTSDSLVISDFVEDWEEIQPFILGTCKHHTIKHLGGQKLIQALASKIEYEIQQRPALNKLFEDNEATVGQNLKCKLNLILYGVHFYKRTEIEVLHKRLRIGEQAYYEFQQVIKNVLSLIPQLEWVNDVIEDYKQHIVYDG